MNVQSHPRERQAWYITTSIPYVNARPHIGFALEAIQADVLARYRRLLGDAVRFQTGADENSLKNVQAAEQEGLTTAQLVERNAARFAQLRTVLDLSFDDFIRTSIEPRHAEGVKKFWQACRARGDIYKRFYRGLYCAGCEQFYDKEELTEGRCPTHGIEVELVEEENYFFRLTRYAGELECLIETGALRIVPAARKEEVLRFVRGGLHDFSISRSSRRARGWGIPTSDDDSQVVYVWFDALLNYITALGYAQEEAAYQEFWVQSAERIHLIGKDITRFHAIYWPAMLLSAGVRLPSQCFVHGFLTVEGQKISKSLGNAIDPVVLAEQFGIDALRYYLLKIPLAGDSDFSRAELVRTYNANLADQLGNLLNRVVSLVVQTQEGIVPTPGLLYDVDRRLIVLAGESAQAVDEALAQFAFHKALAAIWSLIGEANRYIVAVEPWRLASALRQTPDDRENAGRLATTLALLVETVRIIAHLLAPFLPSTAAAIARQIGAPLAGPGAWPDARLWGTTSSGAHVQPGPVLFPKQRLT